MSETICEWPGIPVFMRAVCIELLDTLDNIYRWNYYTWGFFAFMVLLFIVSVELQLKIIRSYWTSRHKYLHMPILDPRMWTLCCISLGFLFLIIVYIDPWGLRRHYKIEVFVTIYAFRSFIPMHIPVFGISLLNDQLMAYRNRLSLTKRYSIGCKIALVILAMYGLILYPILGGILGAKLKKNARDPFATTVNYFNYGFHGIIILTHLVCTIPVIAALIHRKNQTKLISNYNTLTALEKSIEVNRVTSLRTQINQMIYKLSWWSMATTIFSVAWIVQSVFRAREIPWANFTMQDFIDIQSNDLLFDIFAVITTLAMMATSFNSMLPLEEYYHIIRMIFNYIKRTRTAMSPIKTTIPVFNDKGDILNPNNPDSLSLTVSTATDEPDATEMIDATEMTDV